MTVEALPRLLPPKEAAACVGVSVRTLQRMVREGDFVAPVRISKGRIGFVGPEVGEWIANLPRTRGTA